MNEVTDDKFLGGAVRIKQYATGHRSGTDAVLLAASLALAPEQTALELGCGVGVASLCLASRYPYAQITGIDIDDALINLAADNASRNGFHSARFITQDIEADFSDWAIKERFDHVFANPPFYPSGTSHKPPDKDKQRAHIAPIDAMAVWLKRAASLTKAGGCVTLIHRPQVLGELLPILAQRFGGIEILPLAPRHATPAKRILLRGWRDSRAPMTLRPPITLHETDGSYSPPIEASLRDGAVLHWQV